jgi:hypothetical protein
VGAILKQIENKVAVLAVFRKSAAQLKCLTGRDTFFSEIGGGGFTVKFA